MHPTILLTLAGLLSLPVLVAASPMESEEARVLRSLDPRAQSYKLYTDCARCQPGYWRCCFAGCHGFPRRAGNSACVSRTDTIWGRVAAVSRAELRADATAKELGTMTTAK
ncbi:hypothetical protein PG988_011766 [Apiospora saccharicola]